MEPCSAAQLESLLSAYGWLFRSNGEKSWKTGWQGNDRYFGLEVALGEHWITFTVRPLIHTSIDWMRAPDFMRHLLELNSKMQLATLALDEDGHIALKSQVLTTGFNLDCLNHVLGVLGYYADSITKDLALRVRDLKFGEIEAPSHLT